MPIEITDEHIELAKRAGARIARVKGLPVDDCISTAYLGLVYAARRFDESLGVPFEAYAQKVIAYTTIDQARAWFGRERAERPVFVSLPDVETSARIEERLGAREQLRRAHKALDERRRTVMEMVLQGASRAEIGQVLGLAEKTISKISREIRDALREAA